MRASVAMAALPTVWLPLALATAAGLGLTLGARALHRHVVGFLPEDLPGGPRKQHARPTAQVGFLLAGAGAVWLLVAAELALAGAVAILAAVGYCDDRDKRHGGLGWRVKAIAQLASAGLIAAATTPRADLGAWLIVVGIAFLLINAVNFLDNMDGVAASVGGLGVLLATGAEGPLAVVGALFLGFLPCNWPRPCVFLGDGGTLPLGAVLAAAALRASASAEGDIAWLPLLAPTAIPFLDFTQVVCARLWLGYAPWVGDRRHLTHIATYAGLRAVAVAPVLTALALVAFCILGLST